MKTKLLVLLLLIPIINISAKEGLLVGAYYYDGWAGVNPSFQMNGEIIPIGLTRKLYTEFPEREPIWGWRDDDISIMERQIELAANNGIDFFIFCWYWSEENGKIADRYIRQKAEHTSLNLFLKARNKEKMKFAIMIANHPEGSIVGADRWTQFVDYCSVYYFNDPQYLKIEGKPFVSFFLGKEPAKCYNEIEDAAKANGFPGLFSVCCGHRDRQFSANSWYCTFETSKDATKKDYASLVTYTKEQWYTTPTDYNVIPYCMAGWDRRPWFKEINFLYYTDRTPKSFLQNLKDAIDFLGIRGTKNPMLFIYAWNEYGEGGFIAPTKGDKRGRFLKQVKKAKRYSKKVLH